MSLFRLLTMGCVRFLVCAVLIVLSACNDESLFKLVNAEKAQPLHRFDHIQSIAFSQGHLVGVGAYGVVTVSLDGGESWARHELPGAPGLTKVVTCGDGSFAALEFDGQVWSGSADGATWNAAKIPATDAVLDLACTADNHLWVVGARGQIFSSADVGKTWEDKSLTEDIQLLNVQFPTAKDGIITGEFGRVLVSSDGGVSWKQAGSLGADFYPQSQDFKSAAHGIVVGLSGVVLETIDGGKNWSNGKVPTEAPLYGVQILDDSHAVVVGAAGLAFLRSGQTMTQIKGLPVSDLRGMALTPTQLILAGTAGVNALALSSLTSSAN